MKIGSGERPAINEFDGADLTAGGQCVAMPIDVHLQRFARGDKQ